MKRTKTSPEVKKEARKYYWKQQGLGAAVSFVFMGIIGVIIWFTDRD